MRHMWHGGKVQDGQQEKNLMTGSKYLFRRKRIAAEGKIRGTQMEALKTSNRQIHDSLDKQFGKSISKKYAGGNYKLASVLLGVLLLCGESISRADNIINNYQIGVSTDAECFSYGYLSGMNYERSNDLTIINNYGLFCSSPIFIVSSSSSTWDQATCEDTVGNVYRAIYQQYLSTPTIVPGF